MRKYNVRSIIFSSSATVYGSGTPPFAEDATIGLGITNPYGQTKYAIERILDAVPFAADGKKWSIIKLRYFNPVGAHPSGLIGEQPSGIPNNLMPYVAQTAIGIRDHVTVYGDDWPNTKDGTGERDYIHVMDLAAGHLKALEYMKKEGAPMIDVFNLGTGEGNSVLEMIHAFEKACECKVKCMHCDPVIRTVLAESGMPPFMPFLIFSRIRGIRTSLGNPLYARTRSFSRSSESPYFLQKM
jgi:UDP-glucose 4-epimerase